MINKNKSEKFKEDDLIVKATRYNLSHTPIYELIKERVSENTIKKWSKIDDLIPERKISLIEKSFFDFIKDLSEEIFDDIKFIKSETVPTINKYECCVISGLRKHQKGIGIPRANINQVKYNAIKRKLKKITS